MMSSEDFNSWACDIANDYEQAKQEMGPDDYESWEVYSHRRMQQCDEAEAYIMSQASTPVANTYVAPDVDVDDLPF